MTVNLIKTTVVIVDGMVNLIKTTLLSILSNQLYCQFYSTNFTVNLIQLTFLVCRYRCRYGQSYPTNFTVIKTTYCTVNIAVFVIILPFCQKSGRCCGIAFEAGIARIRPTLS